jgi:serine/threonine protein kinase
MVGSFGRVRLAKNKLDGKYYAAKILKKAEIIKLKQVDHIMNETNILFQISHPFIVKHTIISTIPDRLAWRASLRMTGTCT